MRLRKDHLKFKKNSSKLTMRSSSSYECVEKSWRKKKSKQIKLVLSSLISSMCFGLIWKTLMRIIQIRSIGERRKQEFFKNSKSLRVIWWTMSADYRKTLPSQKTHSQRGSTTSMQVWMEKQAISQVRSRRSWTSLNQIFRRKLSLISSSRTKCLKDLATRKM